MKNINKGSIRKVLSYIRPHIGWFILSLLFATAGVAMSLYIPILVGDAIDLIPGMGSVLFKELFFVLVSIGVCIAIGAAAQWLMNVCNNRIAYLVVRNIRDEAFEKLQRLPVSYLDSHRTGETVSKIITDVEQFADGLLMGFSQFFTGILTIAGTLGFMLSLNVKITLVVVLVTPLSLFVAAFIAKSTHSMFVEQSKTRAEQTALIDEIISNQKTVKAFNHEDEASVEFADVNERLRKCSLRATFFSSLTNPSTRFINSIVYTGVALVGALTCLGEGDASLTVGGLSCFLSYANQYTKPFNEISGVVTELQNALACASRVFELIDEPAQTPDKPDAKVITSCEEGIAFTDVSFSYTPEQRLIEHLDLAVQKGQRIAIVGPTGCGKTTLINLLMRFYDVCDGSIAIATLHETVCAPPLAWCFRTRGFARVPFVKISPLENPTQPMRRLSPRQSFHTPIALSSVCRKAMTRLSERAAECFPKAKSSYFASRVLCSACLRFSFLTRQPRPLIPEPRCAFKVPSRK